MSDLTLDKTHRFLFENTDIRGQIVTLEKSYQQVLAQQNLPPCLLPVLGDFIAAVALLSETLKFKGILTLQIRGDGTVPLIMAEATDEGHVRGLLRFSEHLQTGDALPEDSVFDTSSLRALVGHGVLTMTIDPAQGNRYQGIVPLEGDTLADCLAHYFEQSEQVPTRLWLYTGPDRCGGLMLQSLPAQEVKDPEQRRELWQTATQLAQTLRQEELFELDHQTVLYRLFNELECRLFPARDITFHCSCTRARSENAIQSLGRDEAWALLREQGKISIDCQFCGKHYSFKEKDLEDMFGGESGVVH